MKVEGSLHKRQPKAGYSSEITWTAPSNIALVKYWGKKEGQLPMNPSISMTLKESVTRTTVFYREKREANPGRDFFFHTKPEPLFEKKLKPYFEILEQNLPVMRHLDICIESANSFPHSAGIASSASSLAALALCMTSIEEKLSGKKLPENEFFRKASMLARMGSGSAARSVYGGYVLWGESPAAEGSSNEYAVDISSAVHPFFSAMNDAILIVSSKAKKISSSLGHAMMKDNPFSGSRYAQAGENTVRMAGILRNGDALAFMSLVEHEALSLHAMMMTSGPGYLLLKPGTLEIISKVRDYREQTGHFIAFTLDAGPNVHLLYPDSDRYETETFIKKEVMEYCENESFIDDRIGQGPVKNQKV